MAAQRIILLFVDRRAGCVDVVAREIAVTSDDGILGDHGQKIVSGVVRQPYEPCGVIGHEDGAVSGAGSRRFGGEPDFGEPPGGSIFPRGIHPGVPFLFQIGVMRGFAVGVHGDVRIGNFRTIPNILGIEPCAAVRRFEIALFARRFVEFQQVDPLGGETCPEEEASGRRVREVGGRGVDAGCDIGIGAAHGFVQAGRVERGPVEVQGVFPSVSLFPDIEVADAAPAVFLSGEAHEERVFALEDVVKRRQLRNRCAGAVELARRVLDALRRVGRKEEFFA